MTIDYTPKVRERAYLLWEQAGCPMGREHEFWAQASQEIEGDREIVHRTSNGSPAAAGR
jgi:hypothetical protein